MRPILTIGILSLVGISDPTHPDSDGDSMPDGWEFCLFDIYRDFANQQLAMEPESW